MKQKFSYVTQSRFERCESLMNLMN